MILSRRSGRGKGAVSKSSNWMVHGGRASARKWGDLEEKERLKDRESMCVRDRRVNQHTETREDRDESEVAGREGRGGGVSDPNQPPEVAVGQIADASRTNERVPGECSRANRRPREPWWEQLGGPSQVPYLPSSEQQAAGQKGPFGLRWKCG